MKIIKLTAENVKRLKAIEITPEGNLVVIGGMNDQGKTSAIDSIAMAFGGKRAIPLQPVRKGTKKALVICETEDLIVTRTITSTGGGSLKVSTKDGKFHSTPQAILDALTGQLTFDPLAFTRMDRKNRLETLKELVGLDFTGLNTERDAIYDLRTDLNREEKRLSGHMESIPEYPGAPENEISVSGLMRELEKRDKHNQAIESETRLLKDHRAKTWAQRDHAKEIDDEIAKLKEQISNRSAQKAELVLVIKEREEAEIQKEKTIEAMIIADTQGTKNQISNAQQTNTQVRANQERKALENKIKQVNQSSKEATKAIDKIDRKKSELLSRTKFPIPGLSFDETGVTFNGIPFDQASSSEQLKISTAMGFAVNPELKILLIREGSLLDESNLKLLAQMAEKEDGQIWLERVGEGEETSVIIEDGSIK